VAARGKGVIIIPFDYEELPEAQRKKIVPICIAAADRRGNPIAPIWFEEGVAPVQNELRDLAHYRLRDVHRVSELAEITVHKLWEMHGEDAGACPCAVCGCEPFGRRETWLLANPGGFFGARFHWRLIRWIRTCMEVP